MTTEFEFEQELSELIENNGEDLGLWSVRTFADLGLFTANQGLVVRLDDGSEFQLTIVGR